MLLRFVFLGQRQNQFKKKQNKTLFLLLPAPSYPQVQMMMWALPGIKRILSFFQLSRDFAKEDEIRVGIGTRIGVGMRREVEMTETERAETEM